jgi:hypothetical protein
VTKSHPAVPGPRRHALLGRGDSLIEFVVAHARHIEGQRVQRLDRRLVVEQPGQERAAADQVTGGHRVGVAGLLPQPVEGGRQILRTPQPAWR